MRELTSSELSLVASKLMLYVGSDVNKILTDTNNLYLCNRLVLLIDNELFKRTSNISRTNMVYAGTVVGRFTRGGKFLMGITFLSHLSKYAKNRVYVRKRAEGNVLYGNNVLKAHLMSIPENLKAHEPVVIFNPQDVPLGFGITTRSSMSLGAAGSNTIAVIVLGDNGEYLRNESKIF